MKTLQQSVKVKSLVIKELSEAEKNKILFSIYQLARSNLKTISFDYLNKRMCEYQIVTLIQKKEKEEKEEKALLGFSFSQIYFPYFFFSFLRVTLFHCGLTLISKDFRGRKISIAVCFSLYRLVLKKKMMNKFLVFLFGILFTAKCSTPVSFLKIKHFTFFLNWPKIRDKNSLSWLSKTGPSIALSRTLSQLLAGSSSDDFILRGINQGEDYQLMEEKYSFTTTQDMETVRFFKKHIMPHNELITMAWLHPVFLWFHRGSYVHSD